MIRMFVVNHLQLTITLCIPFLTVKLTELLETKSSLSSNLLANNEQEVHLTDTSLLLSEELYEGLKWSILLIIVSNCAGIIHDNFRFKQIHFHLGTKSVL